MTRRPKGDNSNWKYPKNGLITGIVICVLMVVYELLAQVWNCGCMCTRMFGIDEGCKMPSLSDMFPLGWVTFLFVILICTAIGAIIGIAHAVSESNKEKEEERKYIEEIKKSSPPAPVVTPKPAATPTAPQIDSELKKSGIERTTVNKTKKRKFSESRALLFPFNKYLSYAKQGGVVYNYYVGKYYVEGIEKGGKAYPQGLKADVSKGIPYLKYAAEREIADAQLMLAVICMGAYGGEYKDEAAAAEWFGRAAKLGNASGQYMYGLLLQNGNGIQKNAEEAYYWFLESAYRGNTDAMVELCRYYMNRLTEYPEKMTEEENIELQEDEQSSFRWAKCAADNGSSEGMYMTGTFYFNGFGTEKDPSAAKQYLDMAVQNGNDDAKRFIDENF